MFLQSKGVLITTSGVPPLTPTSRPSRCLSLVPSTPTKICSGVLVGTSNNHHSQGRNFNVFKKCIVLQVMPCEMTNFRSWEVTHLHALLSFVPGHNRQNLSIEASTACPVTLMVQRRKQGWCQEFPDEGVSLFRRGG